MDYKTQESKISNMIIDINFPNLSLVSDQEVYIRFTMFIIIQKIIKKMSLTKSDTEIRHLSYQFCEIDGHDT